MDINGHFPAKGLVQEVVLRGGGKILVAPDDVGDAHGVVIHHIGEVVGGHPIRLNEHLVVQVGAVHSDIPKNLVVEGDGAFGGDLLADDIGNPSGQLLLDLLWG